MDLPNINQVINHLSEHYKEYLTISYAIISIGVMTYAFYKSNQEIKKLNEVLKKNPILSDDFKLANKMSDNYAVTNNNSHS